MTETTLRLLAANFIEIDKDDDAWGSDEHIDAGNAYAQACEAVGYFWEEDKEAYEFAMCGAKATGAELVAFTLPRALFYADAVDFLSSITDEAWQRVMGSQCRREFIRLCFDSGDDVMKEWIEAVRHANTW